MVKMMSKISYGLTCKNPSNNGLISTYKPSKCIKVMAYLYFYWPLIALILIVIILLSGTIKH